METKSRPTVFPRTTRGLLFFLLAVVFLPLLLVYAWQQWVSYQSQRSAELAANLEVAHTIELAVNGCLRDIRRQELAIGNTLVRLRPFSVTEANHLLQDSVDESTVVDRWCWISPHGRILASSVSRAVGMDVAQRPYVIAIRAGGDYMVSDLTLSQITGTPVICAAHGIRDDAGTLRGIMLAVIDPESLGLNALKYQRANGGVFTLFDSRGQVIYHSSTPRLTARERQWAYPPMQQALAGRVPLTGIFPWGPDGHPRMTAIVRTAPQGWLVAASRPEQVAMRPFMRSLYRSCALVFGIGLLSLLAAVRLAHRLLEPISRLAEEARAFGNGNLDFRQEIHGPRELEAFAQTLSEMAEQIRGQQAELWEQNEELHLQQAEITAQNDELLTLNDELHEHQHELAKTAERLAAQNTEFEVVMQALETERAFLSTAIDLLPFPIFFVGTAGVPLRRNPAADALVNASESLEGFGGLLLEPQTRVPLPEAQWPTSRALRGEVVRSVELLVVMPDHREIPVLVHAAPIHVNGETAAAMVAFEDITVLKEADRAKNEFLAVLSHELLTPVTSMMGWAQVAQSWDNTPHTQQALEVIERNARRQKRLVDDLLDVSRVIHGKLMLRTEATDLWLLVEQQVESAMHQAQARDIAIHLRPPGRPLGIMADPARTGQAIANLLNNALKFTESGGSVTITGLPCGTCARILVQDTGRGIPGEKLPELFNPFRQLPRDESTGGLGLGLALVKGIIELQHGRVCADSAGPGQGSTFVVEMPLADG